MVREWSGSGLGIVWKQSIAIHDKPIVGPQGGLGQGSGHSRPTPSPQTPPLGPAGPLPQGPPLPTPLDFGDFQFLRQKSIKNTQRSSSIAGSEP